MNVRSLQMFLRKSQWWVLPLVWVASFSESFAEFRMWTDASGQFQIQADFVDMAGENVRLKKSDGQLITVPLKALSVKDQEHVQSLMASESNFFRMWEDATGKFQIYAEFLQVVDGNVHLKRKVDAQVIVVPLAALSANDQAFIQSQLPKLSPTATGPITFQTQVKSILEENCIRCHGAETQKGGLRLDTRGAALGGGDSGTVLVPGNAEKSLIYKLVILDEDHQFRMPPKGPTLSPRQQVIIKDWIDAGADWPGQLQDKDPNRRELTDVPPSSYRGQLMVDPSLIKKHSRQIDTLMDIWFSKKGQSKNPPVSDEVFLRRVYLDIAGRIPSLPEYETFMSSNQPDKRDQLISKLLDSPAFVSHTYNQWLDALRVKQSHLKFNSETYMVWIQNAIRENMPYDEFVREQLSASGHVNNPETAAAGYFIRDRSMPEDRVATTMQLFLGTSMVCAQCHDHPSDKWTQMDFYKLYAFFNGTVAGNGGALGLHQAMAMSGTKKEGDFFITREGKKLPRIRTEHHYKALGDGIFVGGYGVVPLPSSYKYDDGKPHQMIKADVPFRPAITVDYEDVEPFPQLDMSNKVRKLLTKRKNMKDVNSREDFARWATSPDNHMFNKTIVNRLWDRVFGVPLVGPLTDISEREMGENPRMTAYLIQLIKKLKYDQKLFLEILYKTDTYQRVAFDIPALGERPMGAPVVRRLSSEQIWDSIVTLRNENPDKDVTKGSMTSASIMYVEMNKREGMEQFRFVSDNRNLMAKADPSLVKELAPRRDPGRDRRASLFPSPASAASFLGVFGQAEREVIDDSVQEATITQALYLMNSPEVAGLADAKQKRQMKNNPTSELAKRLRASGKLDAQTIGWAYNAILTRQPSDRELELVTQHLSGSQDPMQDLVWSLLNTTEFKLKQ